MTLLLGPWPTVCVEAHHVLAQLNPLFRSAVATGAKALKIVRIIEQPLISLVRCNVISNGSHLDHFTL